MSEGKMMLQELKRESIRHTWWLIVVGMILSISLGSSCRIYQFDGIFSLRKAAMGAYLCDEL